MLQDSLRCYRETGRGVCGDLGPGVGWGFEPGRGVGIRAWARDGGIRTPGAGCGFGPRARGGMGIRAPGAGWGFRPWARGGDFFGKMGNFLPFCRFFAVWVGICISSRLCMILNITPTQQIRIPVKIIHIVI